MKNALHIRGIYWLSLVSNVTPYFRLADQVTHRL